MIRLLLDAPQENTHTGTNYVKNVGDTDERTIRMDLILLHDRSINRSFTFSYIIEIK
jgi:hypothetical protein